jgi:hypothetical protein
MYPFQPVLFDHSNATVKDQIRLILEPDLPTRVKTFQKIIVPIIIWVKNLG